MGKNDELIFHTESWLDILFYLPFNSINNLILLINKKSTFYLSYAKYEKIR
jgi:hypothetical protein